MFKSRKFYPCLALISAIICLILLSNCGGGGNSTIVPSSGVTSTPNSVTYTDVTPTPVLTSKPVSGYIYGNNITTEDGETVPRITVLDVPGCQADSSGNEPFVTQVSNSLQQDYPEDWANSSIQELYTQLNKTLSESKPLPEYNAQAQVSSAYDDTSIPVGSDGHFDNTVLTGATDSNVKLEVALGEDNYAEVETLPSSGSINSSDVTSAAVIKSCPEKIFAFPGEIIIFKVYSEPGINLKSAGLKFTLNNSSIGCITQPVYLCLFGAHKYQVAYSCVYIKHGLDTPVDTTITAKLNSGQSMNIFLEVIKKTASVSGTVYTGGSTLVKGYVKSLGPKACCKIDASGNYNLPKVFRGHSRSVIATWWTSENGKKVRHREEKVIDFLNADLTRFNFGAPPTPTATPTFPSASDTYYGYISADIIKQKLEWQQELGWEQGRQKTVDWLNGNVADTPLPAEIANAIQEAKIDENDPYTMWWYFKSGVKECITDPTPPPAEDANTILRDEEPGNQSSTNTIIANSDAPIRLITKEQPVLMLGVKSFEYRHNKKRIFLDPNSIKSTFEQKRYNVTLKGIMFYTLPSELTQYYANNNKENSPDDREHPDIEFLSGYHPDPNIGPEKKVLWCRIGQGGNGYNVVKPQDFEATNLNQYGVIYIDTHGNPDGLMACPYYVDNNNQPDEQLKSWMTQHSTPSGKPINWHYSNVFFGTLYPERAEDQLMGGPNADKSIFYRAIFLEKGFFVAQDYDFNSKSIVYINACASWPFYYDNPNTPRPFLKAGVYIGAVPDGEFFYLHNNLAYNFFSYILGRNPSNIGQKLDFQLNVRDAYTKTLKDNKTNDGELKIFTGTNGANDNTYLASDVSVVVCKERFIINDETINELKKKLSNKKKLESIEVLRNKTFSQDELKKELEKLSFTEQEIKFVMNYTFYKNN
ncbi:MAG: hypothetical protein ABRQ38_00895 [Candidatus Eremiobacterota bacterium]